MKPTREKKIGRNLVEEYYWAWRYVVYVNNKRYDGTFEEAVEMVEKEVDHESIQVQGISSR